jgi:uncharacterized protein YjcR
MGDIRAPNDIKQAYKDYMEGMKYKDIASKYNVSLATVKSWKTRYKWDRKSMHTKKEKVCIQKENDEVLKPSKEADLKDLSKKKKKSSETNVNKKGAPIGNKNAELHGLYAKYFPEETQEIIELIKSKDKLEILWEQITIQYAAIIRAQRIMYVRDKDDMARELKKIKSSEHGEEMEYELQFAWDRHATFLNAQSRAMGELRNLIKQYDIMLNANWNLATEEQKLRIEKLKLDVENIKGDSKDKSQENWANTLIEIAKRRGNNNG